MMKINTPAQGLRLQKNFPQRIRRKTTLAKKKEKYILPINNISDTVESDKESFLLY